MYQALIEEGKGLTGSEAAEVDATLEFVEEWEYGDGDKEYLAREYAATPLLQHQSTVTGKLIQEESESVMSNKTGMQLTFLSTQSAGNGIKAATSAAVRTLQSVWLFECGEDTQRSLLGHPLVDWKRIDRVFVSSMTPEAVMGLPGMLCTISASRDKGQELSDIPVHVYGPAGLVQFVTTMLAVSRTYLEMPVVLHEFSPRAVPPDQMATPTEVLRRSRLYAVPLPPDQLNPEGYYDGQLSTMLARHTKKRANSGADLRAGSLPQDLPQPGDPTRTGLAVGDMCWTVRLDPEWVLTAIPLKNRIPTLGFVVQEASRMGRLYPEVATALGVEDKDMFTELKLGNSVTVPGGGVVRPGQCVGPVKPGRRVAIVPPSMDSAGFVRAAGAADVVIHSMVPPEGVTQSVDEVCRMAGQCAASLGARELVLWQPLTSFLESSEADVEELPLQAREAAKGTFEKEHVSLAGSFRAHQWDREGGDALPPELPEELAHLV